MNNDPFPSSLFSASINCGEYGDFSWSGAVSGYGSSISQTFHQPGYYTATVTHNFVGGSISKKVFLTVIPEEIPPPECEGRLPNLGDLFFKHKYFDKVTLLIPLSDPADPQWVYLPITASNVTRCTPEERNLWGEYKLISKDQNSLPGTSFDIKLNREEIIVPSYGVQGNNTKKLLVAPGHFGGGVHYWHRGGASLGFLQTTFSSAGVFKASVKPILNPTEGAVTVPEDNGTIDQTLEITVRVCEITGIYPGEIFVQGEERTVRIPCADWPESGSPLPYLDAEVAWHGNQTLDSAAFGNPTYSKVVFTKPGEDFTVSATLDGHFQGQKTFHSHKFNVARVDLDVIPVGGTEVLSDEEKINPGAWIAAKNSAESPEPEEKAILLARPTVVAGLTRKLEWDQNALIVRDKQTGALISSGIILEESEGLREFTVVGRENLVVGTQALITMKVYRPNGSLIASDIVRLRPFKLSVQWLKKNVTPITDLNPNSGGGLRYYPCKNLPTDALSSNEIKIRITSSPPMPGEKVKLRTFDVDDPSDDFVNGPAGNDNRPDHYNTPNEGAFFFQSASLPYRRVTLDSNGEAIIDFRVGMQPGNNYRIAIALDAHEDLLDDLQVETPGNPGFVPSGNEQLDDFWSGTVTLSPMLTIWRKLFVEHDSMDEITDPKPAPDRIAAVGKEWQLNTPEAGQSRLILDGILIHNVPGNEKRYDDGRIVSGGTEFRISAHHNGSTHFVDGMQFVIDGHITIVGVPGTGEQEMFVGQEFKVFDDDDFGLSQSRFPILPRFDLLTPGVLAKFEPAYITLIDVDTLGLNLNKIVPFQVNEESSYMGSANAEDLRDHAHENDWWSLLIVSGYQGPSHLDGDPGMPDPEMGIFKAQSFPNRPGYAVIFLEAVREDVHFYFHMNNFELGNQHFLRMLDNVVAHEIGHGPLGDGSHHQEGGLMGTGVEGEDFSPLSKGRLRSAQNFRR